MEMLNWKEALKYLTDDEFYVNDEYLTGNLYVNSNSEGTEDIYKYPYTIITTGDKMISPEYYSNNQLDVEEVINYSASSVSNPEHIKIFNRISNNYKYFGVDFTNVFLKSAYINDTVTGSIFKAEITYEYEYEGGTVSASQPITYWFYIPINSINKANQYVDFEWINTHITDSSLEPKTDYVIPKGAAIKSCTIQSIAFDLEENNYKGYLDFYSPDTDKIRLSTNRLFDSMYKVKHTTRFTEESDELTRRLISRGVLADALFAEQDKCKNRWSQIFNKIAETQDEYSKLIRIQKDNIATITDAIKNVTTIRFNDTPQTSNDFTGNEFNSTITTTESEVQLGTLADKLDIAKKALNDLYDSWLANFRTFYIY